MCSYQSTNYTIRITSTDKSKSTHSPVTRGPFNGTTTSDNVTFSENMEEGKTYQINVEFTSDVLPEPLMVFKDICKCRSCSWLMMVRGMHAQLRVISLHVLVRSCPELTIFTYKLSHACKIQMVG